MSWRRIRALILQEWYITTHSLEVVSDLFILTVVGLLVFGFFGLFLGSTGNARAAEIVILGFVFWELFHVSQYTVSVTTMWNIWSRNLTNLFIAPISLSEYVMAQCLAGLGKALIVFALDAAIAAFAFHVNVFTLPLPTLIGAVAILTVSGWAIGLALLGFIFAFGTRYQALTWAFIFILQPLTAAFYPVAVLPTWLQPIAWLLPPTYAFEAVRTSLVSDDWVTLIGIGLGLTVLWLGLSIFIFLAFERRARVSGQFAKNE